MESEKLYRELVDRNIGFLTQAQQEVLKNSCVAIFGVGGLGGVAAELVCRYGVSRIKIIEETEFEPTNLNRQIFCFRETIGKKKIDVAEAFLKDINPHVEIEKYLKEDSSNIAQILKGVNIVLLCVDKSRACLLVSRRARAEKIPLVESWAIPYANVRVFTEKTISLEEAYGLPSIGREVEDISEGEFRQMDLRMLEVISQFEGIKSFYGQEAMQRILQGVNPTFAPSVWLNAVLMSLEAAKVLLNWGHIALAPEFSLYDPFSNQVPKQGY
jgi:molybdopterin/thiamine biosynthesis adenylyltransferase